VVLKSSLHSHSTIFKKKCCGMVVGFLAKVVESLWSKQLWKMHVTYCRIRHLRLCQLDTR